MIYNAIAHLPWAGRQTDHFNTETRQAVEKTAACNRTN